MLNPTFESGSEKAQEIPPDSGQVEIRPGPSFGADKLQTYGTRIKEQKWSHNQICFINK